MPIITQTQKVLPLLPLGNLFSNVPGGILSLPSRLRSIPPEAYAPTNLWGSLPLYAKKLPEGSLFLRPRRDTLLAVETAKCSYRSLCSDEPLGFSSLVRKKASRRKPFLTSQEGYSPYSRDCEVFLPKLMLRRTIGVLFPCTRKSFPKEAFSYVPGGILSLPSRLRSIPTEAYAPTNHRGSLPLYAKKLPEGSFFLRPRRDTLLAVETAKYSYRSLCSDEPSGFSSPVREKASRRKLFSNVPGGIRTPDRRLRRPLLYPAELLRQICIIKIPRDSYYTLISIFFNSFIKKLIIASFLMT